MKKALVCCFALLLITGSLGGCMTLGKPITAAAISSPMASPATTPKAAPSPAPSISRATPTPSQPSMLSSPLPRPSFTPAPSPTPTESIKPVLIKTNTDIPDVTWNPFEWCTKFSQFFEDKDNVYVLFVLGGYESIYSINKATGKVRGIIKDSNGFAYANNCLYVFLSDEKTSMCSLVCFDLISNKMTTLKTFDQPVYNPIIYGNKLYLALTRKTDGQQNTDLFSMNLDGSEQTKVLEDASEAVFQKNKIYFTKGDESPLLEYDLQSKHTRQVTQDTIPMGFSGTVAYGKAFIPYSSATKRKEIILDMNSGKTIEKDNWFLGDIFGQYLVYREILKTHQVKLVAYDMTTDKEYTLLDVTDLFTKDVYMVHCGSTVNNYYLCTAKDDGLHLYRLIIEKGKASIVEVTKPAS